MCSSLVLKPYRFRLLPFAAARTLLTRCQLTGVALCPVFGFELLAREHIAQAPVRTYLLDRQAPALGDDATSQQQG